MEPITTTTPQQEKPIVGFIQVYYWPIVLLGWVTGAPIKRQGNIDTTDDKPNHSTAGRAISPTERALQLGTLNTIFSLRLHFHPIVLIVFN